MKQLLVILFSFLTIGLSAQVQSNNLVNIHKLTTAQVSALTNLDKGMLIFNTDSSGLYFYDGTTWVACKTAKVSSFSYVASTGSLNLVEGGNTYTTKIDYRTPLTLSGSTLNWNYSQGYNANATLTANSTLAITNATAGSYGTIVVKQDATGNRTLTVPANSKVACSGSGQVTISKTANSTSILTFYYDGTTYFWTCGQNFN